MKLNDPSDPRIIRPSGGDSRHKMPAATPADRGLSASRNASEVVRNMLRKVSSNYASLTLITRRKHLILLAISVLTPWCSGLGRRKQNSRNDAAGNRERRTAAPVGQRFQPVPKLSNANTKRFGSAILILHCPPLAVWDRQDACPTFYCIVPA